MLHLYLLQVYHPFCRISIQNCTNAFRRNKTQEGVTSCPETQNDLSYLIKEHIFHCCAVHETIPELEAYQRAALAGALYGIIDEWIRRGMGNIPEELSLRSMLHIFPAELQ